MLKSKPPLKLNLIPPVIQTSQKEECIIRTQNRKKLQTLSSLGSISEICIILHNKRRSTRMSVFNGRTNEKHVDIGRHAAMQDSVTTIQTYSTFYPAASSWQPVNIIMGVVHRIALAINRLLLEKLCTQTGRVRSDILSQSEIPKK